MRTCPAACCGVRCLTGYLYILNWVNSLSDSTGLEYKSYIESVTNLMSFSERYGYKPVKNVIQIDSINRELRNGLWNTVRLCCFNNEKTETIIISIFLDYFKKMYEEIPRSNETACLLINQFFFKCEWYEVYDFLEFCLNSSMPEINKSIFKIECNRIMERELSGYRIVDDQVTKITSEGEITEIEEALEKSQTLAGVNAHIRNALSLLSDKTSPDYRNSIKESISAVEAICILIAEDKNASLGKALTKISKQGKIPIHGALNEGFQKLYGYTSSAEGIRHALIKEPNLEFEDAKFMLVACSAFINYLISKASNAGITINQTGDE